MSERSYHLDTFLREDLDKYFEKYSLEKFVSRRMRATGIDTVGDLLALEDEVQFAEYFSKENQTVRQRSRKLWEHLNKERGKISRRITQQAVQDIPVGSSATHPSKSLSQPSPSDAHVSPADTFRLASTPSTDTPPDVEVASPPVSPSPVTGSPELSAGTRAAATPTRGDRDTFPGEQMQNDADFPAQFLPPPIKLGRIVRRDRFGISSKGRFRELPFDEEGLRCHVLIAGSTGSGKTVAARYIVELAAISGVPSIVLDAQGDLSSLVLQVAYPDNNTLATTIAALQNDVQQDKINKHLDALKKHQAPISKLYTDHCLPRIFTPGRADLGLQLALPPYSSDILATRGEDSADESTQYNLEELLATDLRNFVKSRLPKAKPEDVDDYEEVLINIFHYAHDNGIVLEGPNGIAELSTLLGEAPQIVSHFEKVLSDKALNRLIKAVDQLRYRRYNKWLEGHPLDIPGLLLPSPDGRTPINIVNVHELTDDDKKLVLRQIIVRVIKFAYQNPKQSGSPSLLLYVDEIGGGYGERTVGRKEKDSSHNVYDVLSTLVRQARKYGVSVVLASQSFTDFYPDLRRNLGTWIIGNIKDKSEQQRVRVAIGEDMAQEVPNLRDFVEHELPTLGPPKLLYIGKRGGATTYEQFKCCTLDITLKSQDVRRWRDKYAKEAKDSISYVRALCRLGASVDLSGERRAYYYEEALHRIEQAVYQCRFLEHLRQSAEVSRGRCLVHLNRPEEAFSLFVNLVEGNIGDAEEVTECLKLGRDLAAYFRKVGDSAMYVTILQKMILFTKDRNVEAYRQLNLKLSKYYLFSDKNPDEARICLKAIGRSDNRQISLFVRAWDQVVGLFRNWRSVWNFFVGASLVKLGDEPLSITITNLPKNVQDAQDQLSYTSDLVTKPEILHLSRLVSAENTEEPGKSGTLTRYEFIQLIASKREHFERFRSYKQARLIADAVRELQEYFKEPYLPQFPCYTPPLPQPVPEEKESLDEISNFEQDPEVRMIRIANWIEEMDWRKFELEVAVLFIQMGYKAYATKASGDGGVDVRAVNDSEKVVIQCKHYNNKQKVGQDAVKALHATKEDEGASRAVIVTTSTLESGAREWAERKGVEVIEGRRLVELFEQYCNPEKVAPEATPRLTLSLTDEVPKVGTTQQQQIAQCSLFEERKVSMPDLDFKDRQILELFNQRDEIRNKDVQDLLHLSRPAAGNRLRKLVYDGYLSMHGTKAVAYYTKAENAKAANIS